MTLRPIRRALLSVFDKAGLVEFATALANRNVQLISTGGTAKTLRDAGLKVIDVSEVTGFPEIMDGRVKTLHPKIHGGFLGVRDNPEHAKAMKDHAIEGIDLLVSNLYPFEATVAKGASYEETVENIDIGGPAMIRAASKNHDYVTVVVDPEDYAGVLAELDANKGATTLKHRRKLAQIAYARTSAYDAEVSGWLARELAKDGDKEPPRRRTFGGQLRQSLHRHRPVSALVRADHHGLEVAVGLLLDAHQRQAPLPPDLTQPGADSQRVRLRLLGVHRVTSTLIPLTYTRYG